MTASWRESQNIHSSWVIGTSRKELGRGDKFPLMVAWLLTGEVGPKKALILGLQYRQHRVQEKLPWLGKGMVEGGAPLGTRAMLARWPSVDRGTLVIRGGC